MQRIYSALIGFAIAISPFTDLPNAKAAYDSRNCFNASQIAIAEALSKGDISAAARAQAIYSFCGLGNCESILSLTSLGPRDLFQRESYLNLVSSAYSSCKAASSGTTSSVVDPPKYSGPKPHFHALLKLDRVNFPKHNFATLNFSGRQATYSDFAGSNFSFCICKQMNFKGSNLANANLKSANLYRTNISRANISNANLSQAFLYGVSSGGLKGVPSQLPQGYKLEGGYLIGPGVNLDHADLRLVNLAGVNLSFASLSYANLDGVSMLNVKLDHAWGAKGIKGIPKNLSKKYKIINGNLVGPKLKLIMGNLSGLDISGMELSDANFGNISSGLITGTPKNLPKDWKLVNGYLVGPTANLENADFTESDLRGANLTGADLGSANLTNANLANSILKSIRLTDSILTGANLEGATITNCQCWRITSGKIIGLPKTMPEGWEINSGYFLQSASQNLFRFGLFDKVQNLSGVNLSGKSMWSSEMPGWNLSEANFHGTDLWGSNLSHTNLSGADLSGADLSEVNLTGANLVGANLVGANLVGANLTGVVR